MMEFVSSYADTAGNASHAVCLPVSIGLLCFHPFNWSSYEQHVSDVRCPL